MSFSLYTCGVFDFVWLQYFTVIICSHTQDDLLPTYDIHEYDMYMLTCVYANKWEKLKQLTDLFKKIVDFSAT